MQLKKILKLEFVQKKIWRRVIRTVLVLVGMYILLLAGLSIYISSSKEKLIGFLKSKLKETILGELKIIMLK